MSWFANLKKKNEFCRITWPLWRKNWGAFFLFFPGWRSVSTGGCIGLVSVGCSFQILQWSLPPVWERRQRTWTRGRLSRRRRRRLTWSCTSTSTARSSRRCRRLLLRRRPPCSRRRSNTSASRCVPSSGAAQPNVDSDMSALFHRTAVEHFQTHWCLIALCGNFPSGRSSEFTKENRTSEENRNGQFSWWSFDGRNQGIQGTNGVQAAFFALAFRYVEALTDGGLYFVCLVKCYEVSFQEQLTCPSCKVKRKDAVLTKCFHVFCLECLKTRYETRQRKCPKCNATFGAKDYHRLYLTWMFHKVSVSDFVWERGEQGGEVCSVLLKFIRWCRKTCRAPYADLPRVV